MNPTTRWTFTTSRHHSALVFACSVAWHGVNRYSSTRGITLTIGLGLWSLHLAYRHVTKESK